MDALQNGHGKLLVAPFSARPVKGASVSMPLRWREVNADLDPASFQLKNAAARMRKLRGDPLAPVRRDAPDLLGAASLIGPSSLLQKPVLPVQVIQAINDAMP